MDDLFGARGRRVSREFMMSNHVASASTIAFTDTGLLILDSGLIRLKTGVLTSKRSISSAILTVAFGKKVPRFCFTRRFISRNDQKLPVSNLSTTPTETPASRFRWMIVFHVEDRPMSE